MNTFVEFIQTPIGIIVAVLVVAAVVAAIAFAVSWSQRPPTPPTEVVEVEPEAVEAEPLTVEVEVPEERSSA